MGKVAIIGGVDQTEDVFQLDGAASDRSLIEESGAIGRDRQDNTLGWRGFAPKVCRYANLGADFIKASSHAHRAQRPET